MSFSAGVHRVTDSLWERVNSSYAGAELLYPRFALLRGLIYEEDIHLDALETVCVLLRIAKAEKYLAAVWERDEFLLVVVVCQPLLGIFLIAFEHLYERLYVVVPELRVCLSHYQYLDPGVLIAEQYGFVPYCPAFPASAGSSVADVLVRVEHEKPLFLARPLQYQFHSSLCPVHCALYTFMGACSRESRSKSYYQ